MSNEANENKPGYDLEERTTVFAESCIDFAYSLPVTPVTRSIIDQFVRSSTSIGANYTEANNAESKKDFRHKIGICRKESGETKYWIRIISKACPDSRDRARELWNESNELNLIFSKIFRSTNP